MEIILLFLVAFLSSSSQGAVVITANDHLEENTHTSIFDDSIGDTTKTFSTELPMQITTTNVSELATNGHEFVNNFVAFGPQWIMSDSNFTQEQTVSGNETTVSSLITTPEPEGYGTSSEPDQSNVTIMEKEEPEGYGTSSEPYQRNVTIIEKEEPEGYGTSTEPDQSNVTIMQKEPKGYGTSSEPDRNNVTIIEKEEPEGYVPSSEPDRSNVTIIEKEEGATESHNRPNVVHLDEHPAQNLDPELSKTYYATEDNKKVPHSHPCSRRCVAGATPMECLYEFNVEWYQSMSKACFQCPINSTDCDRPHCVPTDGFSRPIVTINRMMPGPTIRVCKGDTVQVDVINHMTEESTSIHWHGHHQRGTPYMDGVPYVTQCPIPPGSAFRYRFTADVPGTHFWHSHSGCQRADGAYGALIVRVPKTEDPHAPLFHFDFEEHIVQLGDWIHELGIAKFTAHHHARGNNKPSTLLINGRGISNQSVPPTIFNVIQGFRFRFRLINNGFLNCPIQVSIDDHNILVINSDGADIKPILSDSLVIYAGERFDFILHANAPIKNYWIWFRGLMDCGPNFTKAHQVAILRYDGAPTDSQPEKLVSYENSNRIGLTVNALNVGPESKDSVVVSEMKAEAPYDIRLRKNPDLKFYLGYDFYAIDNPQFHFSKYYSLKQVTNVKERLFTPQLNHISLKLPPFPLLSQYKEIKQEEICNSSTVTGCETHYCECTHIINVPLSSVVELILIDIGNMYDANHPFHLHGYSFRVVAMGQLGRNTSVAEVRALDDLGKIKRNLVDSPIKDTVTVPDGGYTVLRFHANNPGYWLFHCHIEFHVELGMAIVFKVGEHDQFPELPPEFPRCNKWLPKSMKSGVSSYQFSTDVTLFLISIILIRVMS